MQNQSFQKHHVVAIPTLLKTGFDPMQLAVGQIGIFGSESNSATTNPSSEKAVYIGYRLPKMRDAAMARAVATPYYTHGIKGANVVGWRGYRGHRGKTDVVAIGFDGVDTSKNLSATLNDTKDIYILLSGSPITKMISGQGLMLRYNLFTGCNCATPPCAASATELEAMADDLVNQINKDKAHYGFIEASKIVANCNTPANYTTIAYNCYTLNVNDAGDDYSLGLVQALYSTPVERIGRNGIVSTYKTCNTTGLPSAFNTSNVIVIPECTTCPTGYTLRSGYVYTYDVEDAGNAAALTNVLNLWGISSPSTTNESVTRISYNLGVSRYLIVSNFEIIGTTASSANEVQTLSALTAGTGNVTIGFDGKTITVAHTASNTIISNALIAAGISGVTVTGGPLNTTAVTFTFGGAYAGLNVPLMTIDKSALTGTPAGGVFSVTTPSNFDLDSISGGTYIGYQAYGQVQSTCVLDSATSVAWSLSGTGIRYQKTHSITLGDTVCGTSRLAELQSAYAGVGTVAETSAANCARVYTITVQSNTVEATCYPDEAVFPTLAPYNGTAWSAGTLLGTAGSGANCRVGVIIKAAAFNPYSTECTFGNFTDDFDGISMRVSEFDNDYNSEPALCRSEWPITKLQSFALPSNLGSQVRQLEETTYLDVLRGYSYDAGVRLAEGFKFMTDTDQVYDTYTLEYRVSYPVGGFSERYTDTYHEHFHFVQGTGKDFETAMNAWIGTINPSLAPVVL